MLHITHLKKGLLLEYDMNRYIIYGAENTRCNVNHGHQGRQH